MYLPAMTNMTLSIQHCTGLKGITNKKLKQKFQCVEAEYLKAQEEFRALAEKTVKPENNHKNLLNDAQHEKDIQKALDKIKEKEAALKNCPIDDDGKVIPNPFVVVAIDEDNEDRRPMLCTKCVRGETNPIWKEKFDKFPLFLYLNGKVGYERFANGDKDYRPQNLVFIIYHDDGIPKDDEAKLTDDTWKREKPQRKIPIGRVEWDFHDVCRMVGCPEFEKELPIINPDTRRKIKDATFTIKVKLCAPSTNCACIAAVLADDVEADLDDEIDIDCDDDDDDDDYADELPASKVEDRMETKVNHRRRTLKVPSATAHPGRKFVRSKSRNRLPNKLADDMYMYVPFQKPTKKHVSKKQVRFTPNTNLDNNDQSFSYV